MTYASNTDDIRFKHIPHTLQRHLTYPNDMNYVSFYKCIRFAYISMRIRCTFRIYVYANRMHFSYVCESDALRVILQCMRMYATRTHYRLHTPHANPIHTHITFPPNTYHIPKRDELRIILILQVHPTSIHTAYTHHMRILFKRRSHSLQTHITNPSNTYHIPKRHELRPILTMMTPDTPSLHVCM